MQYAKAIWGGVSAALVAGLAALAVVLVGDTTLDELTQGQWVVILLAVLTGGGVTGGAVARVRNATPDVLVRVDDAGRYLAGDAARQPTGEVVSGQTPLTDLKQPEYYPPNL